MKIFRRFHKKWLTLSGIVIALVIIGVILLVVFSDGGRLEQQQESTWKKAAECEALAPIYGDYVQRQQDDVDNIDGRLIGGLGRLRKGMTRQQVREILGVPSYTDARSSKEGADYWGCDWGYVLRAKYEDDTLTITDEIAISFGADDRLEVAVRRNQYHEPIK